jgi:hypothetical protein
VVEFIFSDIGAPIPLGKMFADYVAHTCIVEIKEAFDGGTTITVGDSVAQGRFHAGSDNHPDHVGEYEHESNFSYGVETETYIFVSGIPTTGRARVILYLH